VFYSQLENSYIIEPNICSKQGWGGIAFHQKSGIDSSMFIATSWFIGDKIQFGELQDHESKKLKKIATIGLLLPNDKLPTNLEFLEKQRFQVKVDYGILKKFDYISIVCSNSPVVVNQSSVEFSYHQTLSTRQYNISVRTSQCDSFSLNSNSRSLADSSQWYWFIEMGFYLGFFLLIVQFRNYQPLQSRGFIPYLAILSQYGASLSSVQHFFFNLEFRSKYSCVMQTLMHYNFFSTIFCIMPLNYLRYVLLINLNREKKNVSIDGKKKSFYFNLILYLKFLTKPMVSFTILALFFIIVSSVDLFFLGIISPSWECSTVKSFVFYSIHFAINISMGIILLGIGVFDVVLNVVKYFKDIKRKSYKRMAWLKLIRDNFLDFFWKQDPYFFRTEKIFALIVFVLYILFEIMNYNNLIFGTENPFHYHFGGYFLPAARSFIKYAFAFCQAFLPLSITMGKLFIKWIKKITKKPIEVNWDELDEKLNDNQMYDIFLNFAKHEWSQENVLSYRDIQKFKRAKKDKKENLLFNFYYLYLNGSNSPLELNISWKIRQDFYEKINNGNCDYSKENIFENVEKTVKLNISDTWSRFIITSAYSIYFSNIEVQEAELVLI
jgi:hypothetical protein